MSVQFELLVFGATGDAGRAIARQLARCAPPSLRWGVAGRSASKLSKLVSSFGDGVSCGTMLASCDDPVSMGLMAASTRLVITAAGPYSSLGEPVIVACLKEGAHYVDITGEVDWVNAMKRKYGKEAEEKGICICSFCGYDCESIGLMD